MADALILEITPQLDRFLGLVAKHDEDVREQAEQYRSAKAIPWEALKKLYDKARPEADEQRPWLHELCRGSRLVLDAPKPRVKSKALQKRLQMLQEQLDNERYADMVSDITAKEREAAANRNAILPTFRLQASFGLHVIVTMGTFYAIGWYAGNVTFGSPAAAALGGVLGLTFGMLLETTLLIIRSNRPTPLSERMPQLTDPHFRGLTKAAAGGSRLKEE